MQINRKAKKYYFEWADSKVELTLYVLFGLLYKAMKAK